MIVIGIDPGITGAIAVLRDGNFCGMWDMPLQNKGKPTKKRSPRTGKMLVRQKKEIDPWQMYLILNEIFQDEPNHFKKRIFIEQVSSGAFGQGRDGEQRTQGVVSAFGFGDSFGTIRGVCATVCCRENVHFVRPQEWKKYRGFNGHDKDVCRQSARLWYADAQHYLERKKDIGRADALMIADYGVHICTR